MSLRATELAELRRRLEDGVGSIEYEIAGEQAFSLGHHGRKVEASVTALRTFEGPAEARMELVRSAAKAVWAYFVQREACGMRNHREVIQFYGIPGEVLARLGAVER
ncbi:DUF6665 family protein [Devosia sp.]|uniref:DUF6665 family protein n=1 Tax=Devosia sp. TaxID=1871048 RepID=UPI003A9415F8